VANTYKAGNSAITIISQAKRSKKNILDVETKRVFSWLEVNKGRWKTVAELSGVSYGTINKLMNGQREDPRISTLIKLYELMLKKPSRVS